MHRNAGWKYINEISIVLADQEVITLAAYIVNAWANGTNIRKIFENGTANTMARMTDVDKQNRYLVRLDFVG